ncbi:molybdenum cofactor biosynthesis bifunctional protein [Synergistales bacterium]|nr:molybdenum cofactor biosynthesis bifunctional protein [Synergistales bacterium]
MTKLSNLPTLDSSTTSSHIENGHPVMVDVSEKKITRREALAEGRVRLSGVIARAVAEHAAGKGDVLKMAELAGIMAAKKTPDIIPLCHNINLSSVEVVCSLDTQNNVVVINARAKADQTTGVEMEALTAVSVAALTIYDMCKGIDKGMTIEGIRLLRKSGGKSGDYIADCADKGSCAASQPLLNIRAGVLTVSDRGSRGERRDTAGPALAELLTAAGALVELSDIVPDEREIIASRVREWSLSVSLILTTGGTGLAQRDVTPEALLDVGERVVPGFGELMRSESAKHTHNAALSRAIAVTFGRCLILSLPGSEKGARECFAAALPALRHAVDILNGASD